MSKLPPNAEGSAASPAINLEFVRAVAETGGDGGLQEVEAFHRSLFLNQYGRDLERFHQQRLGSEDRLADLESRLKAVRDRLAGQQSLLPVLEDGLPDTQPTAPWNGWDRTMFAVAGISAVCLLVFGVFNVSFNLLESGIVTFMEHPVRAYLWAALLPVGALGVKIGWDFLQGPRRRAVYLWTCLTVGLLAVLVWVGTYASVYPALSVTTQEQIASLSVFEPAGGASPQFTAGGAKRMDMILVSAQALAEICLSAALGIYMTRLYARHRPVRLARNPVFAQFDEERRALEDALAGERLALAEAKGGEERLQHQMSAFVAYARSLFQRETAQHRDRGHQRRRLLDEITQQLRAHLEASEQEAGENGSRNGDVGRLVSSPEGHR